VVTRRGPCVLGVLINSAALLLFLPIAHPPRHAGDAHSHEPGFLQHRYCQFNPLGRSLAAVPRFATHEARSRLPYYQRTLMFSGKMQEGASKGTWESL
jgi:hypothetical protein